jgi:hypothetical protein
MMAVERWNAATRMLNIGVAAAYGLALAFAIASPTGSALASRPATPGAPAFHVLTKITAKSIAKSAEMSDARSPLRAHFVVAVR